MTLANTGVTFRYNFCETNRSDTLLEGDLNGY